MPAISRMARAAPPAMTPVPGRRRLQQHPAGAGLAEHRVGDGGAGQRDREQVLLGLLDALLHGQAGLLGLAVAEADRALAVADHHEGGEREPPAALDHLGDPVDLDGPVFVLLIWHVVSELQSGLAGRVGDGGHPAVVQETAPVEDDLADAGGLGPLGDQAADRRRPRPCCRCRRPGAGPSRPSRRRPGCGRRGRRSPGRRCACWSGRPPGGAGPAVPATFLRTRWWRRARATCLSLAATCSCADLLDCSTGVGLLGGLAGLADDPLAGVADAFALVGLGLADLADVGGDLADQLLVDAPAR